MHSLNSLSLGHLRRRARRCEPPLRIRFYRNWSRCYGYDGYVVTDPQRNLFLAGPLNKEELREFLVEHLTEIAR